MDMNIQELYVEHLIKKDIIQFLSKYKDIGHITFFDLYEELFNKYYEEMISRIKLVYPKFKRYELKHFGMQIFKIEVEHKDIDNYYKIQFNGMLYVIEKYNKLILSLKDTSYNEQYFNGIVEYLRINLLCSLVLIQQIEEIKSIQPNRYIGLQNRVNSLESYKSSLNLKHNMYAWSSLSSLNASVFLIRQAIELKIKNCLGIDVILDKNGYVKKMTADRLIEFVFNNSHIKLPKITKSILTSIHKWTQYFVHGGFILNVWQIDIAHELIQPLFQLGETSSMLSIYGSIIIDKNYYENDFEKEIKQFLIGTYEMEHEIKIIFQKPEAIIE